MGIINVTPDSFADGGLRFDPGAGGGGRPADDRGRRRHPRRRRRVHAAGRRAAAADEELRRVAARRRAAGARRPPCRCPSTPTRPSVAREAIGARARHRQRRQRPAVRRGAGRRRRGAGAALVLMHNRGRSREMYREADYGESLGEVAARAAGGDRRGRRPPAWRAKSIIVDPGLGFAKRAEHTFDAAGAAGRQLASSTARSWSGRRASPFSNEALGERTPSEREWGTAAAVTAGVLAGRPHRPRARRARDGGRGPGRGSHPSGGRRPLEPSPMTDPDE